MSTFFADLWDKLRTSMWFVPEFPGFHDEKLKSKRSGQRSSKLDQQYRVIYTVERRIVTALVLEITPHKY